MDEAEVPRTGRRPERPERRATIERPERPVRADRVERPEAADRLDRAVYIISVAAELAGVHPQTLRTYERLGLLQPQRTSGNTRRYSERDIERLRLIQELTQDEGVNLAGVRLIMAMRAQLDEIRRHADELEARLTDRRPADGAIVLRRALARFPWEDA